MAKTWLMILCDPLTMALGAIWVGAAAWLVAFGKHLRNPKGLSADLDFREGSKDLQKLTELAELRIAADRFFENDGVLKRSEVYAAAVQMVTHTDAMSWTRVYNFLTASSILMLAWVTVFTSSPATITKGLVLLFISAGGFFLGFAWAPFGSRGRRLHRLYADKVAKVLEPGDPRGPDRFPGPFTVDVGLQTKDLEKVFRTEFLAVWVPIMFAIIFFFLFLTSFRLILLVRR